MKCRNFIKFTAITPLALKGILFRSNVESTGDITSGISSEDKSPANLLCEYAENPLGVDVNKPRLTWKSASGKQGQKQKAYQILIASTEERLASNTCDV